MDTDRTIRGLDLFSGPSLHVTSQYYYFFLAIILRRWYEEQVQQMQMLRQDPLANVMTAQMSTVVFRLQIRMRPLCGTVPASRIAGRFYNATRL